MSLPPASPPAVVGCPLRDSAQARAAGDSAGRRANADGQILVGVTTGILAGVSGLITLANPGKAGPVFVGSAVGAAANVALAAGSTGVFPRDAAVIADCDSTLKSVYAKAYGVRAQERRKRSAFRSALASFLTTTIVLAGLVIWGLSQGGWVTD